MEKDLVAFDGFHNFLKIRINCDCKFQFRTEIFPELVNGKVLDLL